MLKLQSLLKQIQRPQVFCASSIRAQLASSVLGILDQLFCVHGYNHFVTKTSASQIANGSGHHIGATPPRNIIRPTTTMNAHAT